MQTMSRLRRYPALLSLLLSYAFIISLCAPLTSKQVIAAGSISIGENSTFLRQAIEERAGWRASELLVRFRGGVSQVERNTVIAAHGAQRKKQLRGESGVEQLELGGPGSADGQLHPRQ